ncbi:glycosyltransferase [Rhodococcus pyridinivorans]|nr:glycosyltransferase [Rhodococcus pyridinivorans]
MSRTNSYTTGRSLLENSVALLATTNITSLLGFVFWIVCARNASAGTVGMASTVIPAMTLMAILAASGFVPLLTRVLPGADPVERSGLCSTAFLLAGVVSGAAGVAGGLLMPERVHDAVGTAWLVSLMGVGSASTALLFVVNAALLGIRQAELTLPGNVAGGVTRLITIAALAALGVMTTLDDATAAHAILMIWVASLIIAFCLSVWLLARTTPQFRLRLGRIWLSRLRLGVAWEHAATLAIRSPDIAVPIVASALFPPAQVAYLAMAWAINAAFVAVPDSVSNALLADCADRPEYLRAQVRRAGLLISALLLPPVMMACLLAPTVLGLFGTDYADHSTLLVLLLLASVPGAVVAVAVAVLRVQRRLVAVAAINATGGVITLGGAWLLMPHLGIVGAGWAALASSVIVVLALPALGLRQSLREHPPARSATEPVVPPEDCATESADPTLTTPVPGHQQSQWHSRDARLRGLRILHATDSFLPNVGGMELSTAALVRAQVAQGRVVALATALHPDAPAREDLDGAQIHRLPMAMGFVPGAYADRAHMFFPPVSDPRFARGFADLIRRFRPDIIHARGWVLYSVLGPARRAGVPVVATAHDHSQVCATKIMQFHGNSLCSGPGLRKCLGCAYAHYGLKGIPLAAGLYEIGSRRHPSVAQWMAISSALAARGSAPRPADRGSIEVIPTFLDDDLLTLAKGEESAVRPDFVPTAGPYIFYAGVLGVHKGVDVLLDAYARLRSGGVDVPLVLAGLPRTDFKIPDQPGVVVVTHVPQPAVIAAWRHAAVGVVPSVVPEGFGRVAVECLAAGTPCVVSALGGLLDVVADGVEGVHVPPGDAEALACALRRLLEDEALRLRLGAAGPAKAAHFTLSRVMPRLDDMYLRVLDEVGAAGASGPLPQEPGAGYGLDSSSTVLTLAEEAIPMEKIDRRGMKK